MRLLRFLYWLLISAGLSQIFFCSKPNFKHFDGLTGAKGLEIPVATYLWKSQLPTEGVEKVEQLEFYCNLVISTNKNLFRLQAYPLASNMRVFTV